MDITIRNNIKRERDRSPGDGPPRRQRRAGNRFSSPHALDPNVRSVIVTNIPYAFRWQELKDLFRENVGEVSFVQVLMDESGKSRGCGIIEFETPVLAQLAVKKMNHVDVMGRKLVVKYDDGERERPLPVAPSVVPEQWGRLDLDDRIAREPEPDTSIVWGETYGLSQNFLAGLDIRGTLLTRVFIANLDYTVTRKKLKEVFKMAGRLLDIDLAVNSDNTSRGFATIDYEHPVEAVQAISLFNNQYLMGRKMTVRMDRRDRTTESPRLPEGLSGIGMGLGENGIPLVDVARNLHSLAGAANTATVPPPSINEVVKTQLQLELLKSGIGVPVRVNDGLFPVPPLMTSLPPFNPTQNVQMNDFSRPAPMPNASVVLPGMTPIDHLVEQRYHDAERARHREQPAYDRRDEPMPFDSRRDDRQVYNSRRDEAPMLRTSVNRREEPPFNELRVSDRDLPHRSEQRNELVANNNHQRYSGNDRVGPSGRNNNNNVRSNHPEERGMRSDIILIKNLTRNTTMETLRELYGEFGRVSYTEKQGPEVGIVRFFNDHDADLALVKTNGLVYNGRKLAVSYYS